MNIAIASGLAILSKMPARILFLSPKEYEWQIQAVVSEGYVVNTH